MARTFYSVNEALDFLEAELGDLRADMMVTQALAVVAAQCALQTFGAEQSRELAERSRAQLRAMRLSTGDDDLNLQLLERARTRLDAILAQCGGAQH